MSKACVSVLEMGAARRHQNYSCASEITVGVEGRLVVDDLLLEVGLRVLADRANLRGLLAHVQVTAVEALPDLDARTLEDLALLDALGQLVVALLVGLLDGTDAAELGGDLLEALGLGGLGEALVHVGPLVVLTGGGVLEVGQRVGHVTVVEVLEPELGVLALVAGGLREDVGDLDVALLLGGLGVVAVLHGSLRLAGKGGLEVLLGLGLVEINSHVVPPWVSSPAAADSPRPPAPPNLSLGWP